MAGDIHRLLRNHLDITDPVALVGHDFGLMIAYAYAQAYRNEVSHLAIMDAPLPGTAAFDRVKANPRVWHFAFRNARDIAEMLVTGREREYLQAFFYARTFDPSALDLDPYVSAYSAPGAMRAGFELYRGFEQDEEDNRESLRRYGKLSIPTLALQGEISNSGPLLEEMMHEVAHDVTGAQIKGAAHWIAEESPNALVDHVIQFVRQSNQSREAGETQCNQGVLRSWVSHKELMQLIFARLESGDLSEQRTPDTKGLIAGVYW